MTVTAVSNTPGLIPNTGTGALAVNYTPGSTTGSLTYTPVPGQTGLSTITVFLTNTGSIVNGGSNQTSETFTVSVGTKNPVHAHGVDLGRQPSYIQGQGPR